MINDIKKLIAFIECPGHTVLWNDGNDKYVILKNVVYEHDDELKIYFKYHSKKYIDLYNCVPSDFLLIH